MHINLKFPLQHSFLAEQENVIEVIPCFEDVKYAEILGVEVRINDYLLASFVRNLDRLKLNQFLETIRHSNENVEMRTRFLG